MRVLYVTPTLWQQVVDANGFEVCTHIIDTDTLKVWAGARELVYHTDIQPADYTQFNLDNPSTTSVANEDEAIAHIVGLGGNISPRQADGSPISAPGIRIGREAIYATHNFCDPCTWYSESSRVTDETLSDSGDGLTFNSANTNWIDMNHGRVFDEDGLKEDQALFNPGSPHMYEVVVEVDSVEQTMREPWATSGGDYEVDYESGNITFFASQSGKTVTASYSHAVGSGWILRPLAGKQLTIEKAEVQFAKNITFNATLQMQVYGLVDFFAPYLMTTADPPGPIPPGTPIPIETTHYKTIHQLIDEAVGSFPEIPVFGGRAPAQPLHVFQFHYAAAKLNFDSLGMFLRIQVLGDQPFPGERATATFYLTSKDDPGGAEAIKFFL